MENTIIETSKVSTMPLPITRMSEMLNFYSEVLEIKFEAKEMQGARLYSAQWSGIELLFCPANIKNAPPYAPQLEVVVPNIHQTMAISEKNGGQLLGEMHEDEASYCIGILDPDHNPIVFREFKN